MTGLPRGLGRLLAVLLLLAALGGIGALVWLPVHLMAGQERAVAEAEARIAALEARRSDRERLGSERQRLEGEQARDRSVVRTPTAALAGAELQALVSAIVLGSGGKLESVQILEPREQGPFEEIGLRLTLTVGTEELRHLLYALEASTPAMRVTSLSLRPAGEDGREGTAPPLHVTLQVAAFAAIDQSS
ncbi:type II secretion system protein GspM [Geminicoccaceae bacterium 1502E]|nr:type II secretion system protein GspM [Geminicoccaceae bacterium 1502E]